MSFFRRLLRLEARGIEHPSVPLTSSTARDYLALGERNAAGVSVTESTAMNSTAVWAAVNLLSRTLGRLPCGVFRRLEPTGRQPLPLHPIAHLIRREPNELQTAQIFRETMMVNLLLYGAAYALIMRDPDGSPTALWPIPSNRMRIEVKGGRVAFIATAQGKQEALSPFDVLHIPGLSQDGLTGLSPIRQNAETIGLELAARKFGGSFFGNGAKLDGFVTVPATYTKEQKEELKQSWNQNYKGVDAAFKTAVLSEGMDYVKLGTEPEKGQFDETRRFNVIEVSRIFGIPPHMLASLDRATFSNIEQQAIEFVRYALMPFIKRFEAEFDRKLFGADEKADVFTRFNVNALLEGDSEARGKFYGVMLDRGVMSINEVREREDLNPIDGGNVHRVPMNTEPLAG